MAKILVVDDELSIRMGIREFAEYQGYEVEEAANGKDAVERCRQKDFDIIIMDIMMPVMDGITATKKIRSLERLDAKAIPIIAMTANAFEEDAKKCVEAGMNAHLSKPLQMEQVVETIRECCEK